MGGGGGGLGLGLEGGREGGREGGKEEKSPYSLNAPTALMPLQP